MTDQIMKQPHEDVTGVDRDDDLLSLAEPAHAHRAALAAVAMHLSTATLVGNPAPVVSRMSDRLRRPQPGDLVVETSSVWRRDPDSRLKGFGILLLKRREWWHTDEEWAEVLAEDPGYGDRPTDTAWYVQYGSAAVDVCRWVNCSFMVIPIDPEQFSTPLGTLNERGGVTVTRDDLLGSLADSGFQLLIPGGQRAE